jgi:isoquinoline 1-oxidoreductase subunit alpha
MLAAEKQYASARKLDPGGVRMLRLTINGKTHDVDIEPDTPLLWVIRDSIGMTGTKYGCGIAQCGACTVHIDGVASRSCGVTAADAVGKKITTIEGLADNGVLTKVQKAWVDLDVPQCGYCQSGMIMAVSALLKEKPKPTDADIDEAITNICRCGTFQQVRAAIHAAANA